MSEDVENYKFHDFFSFNPPPENDVVWSLAKNGCDGYCTHVWQKYNPPISFGGPLIYGQWIDIQNHCTTFWCYCVPDAGQVYGEVPAPENRVDGQTYTTSCFCLAKGTKISLHNKKYKKIEDISYSDGLLVWDFDEGKFASAKPLWIKKVQKTNKYILLQFDNGSILKTIDQHRIFNKQKGMFTYPMTDETPVGTISFSENGKEIKLVSKEYIYEDVEFYNIITKFHINLFAEGVLTSCRYNNIYPISDMKFIKEERELSTKDKFNISEEYFYGLRIAEQEFSPEEVEKYVNNLELSRANN
jgi:hypothetical protein